MYGTMCYNCGPGPERPRKDALEGRCELCYCSHAIRCCLVRIGYHLVPVPAEAESQAASAHAASSLQPCLHLTIVPHTWLSKEVTKKY